MKKFKFFEKMAASYKWRVSATKRANELGCRIKQAIDEGKFKLSGGYLRVEGRFNSLTNQWEDIPGKVCEGCAVAAAAFTCGLERGEQATCQLQVVEDVGLMSREEAAQLEMGYENWDTCGTWVTGVVKVNRRSPFYKLGKKMGIAADNRSETDGEDPWD